jgi:catechol 2,3-dioxygenase-like lactoylglutathione lyase family enzyme
VITGFHALIFSNDAVADREFLRDVLGFPYVNDGDGWLIFKLPPAEIGVHPTHNPSEKPSHLFSFMVDDIVTTMADLRAKGVTVLGEPTDRGYGIVAAIVLPGGAEVEIYEPRHRVAKDL